MFDELSIPVLIEAIQEYVWVRGKMVDLALKKTTLICIILYFAFL